MASNLTVTIWRKDQMPYADKTDIHFQTTLVIHGPLLPFDIIDLCCGAAIRSGQPKLILKAKSVSRFNAIPFSEFTENHLERCYECTFIKAHVFRLMHIANQQTHFYDAQGILLIEGFYTLRTVFAESAILIAIDNLALTKLS